MTLIPEHASFKGQSMNQSRDFFLRCKNCRTKNRIPQNKIGTIAKCGRCQEAIETRELLQSSPIMVTDANFEATVLRSALPILMDCWATWCTACAALSTIAATATSAPKAALS